MQIEAFHPTDEIRLAGVADVLFRAMEPVSSRWPAHDAALGELIELCRANAIPVFEKDFSVTEVYGAAEAFVTGTFAGITPVVEVDGRAVGEGGPGPMTERLAGLYPALIKAECPPPDGAP